METKKRNREDLVEQVGVTKKITVAEEISKSELLEEREKKRRNHEALKKQIGTITGDSAVETVKVNNVLLEESKTKEKSTDKVSDKQVDAQTTLKVVVEALKRYQKMPCSLKPSDVRGRCRRIATVKGEKLSTYLQPFTCHQCKRNDTGEVVRCMYCKEGYCDHCIEKWYPQASQADIKRMCPVCLGSCNCKACLPTKGTSKQRDTTRMKLTGGEKVNYSKYMVHLLLPALIQIDREQVMEKKLEAKIQGISFSEMKLQQSDRVSDGHIYCNNCSASIWDYHRNCPHCSYDLCLTCCVEIRNGSIQGGGYDVTGKEFPNGEIKYSHGMTQGQTCDRSSSKNLVRPESKWKIEENGRIFCPCGFSILEMKCMFPGNWVSRVKIKAMTIDSSYSPVTSSGSFKQWCACFNSLGKIDLCNKKLREAACREDSSDNYLYCYSAKDIQHKDFRHFQRHWTNGEPVIVPDILELTSGLSWDPMVMWGTYHERKGCSQTEVTPAECQSCCEKSILMSSLKGIKMVGHGKMSLKISDWLPSGLFEKHLPDHCAQFISALPFQEYTNPECGFLNLSVYVLMHTAEADINHQQSDSKETLKEVCRAQEEVHKGSALKESTLQKSFGDTLQNPQTTQGGTLWDIFRRKDVPKLEEYLTKHSKKFLLPHCSPTKQVVHPIHDQTFYLTSEDKQNLKREFGIEPWTFVQKLGESVLIPAGCPYQIRNMKPCVMVRMDFVSPESVKESINLTQEFRKLPNEHIAKEDKIEVKRLILHTIGLAASYLEKHT
ncbi:hypothetical protein ACHQM5_005037 [Ranunculus cassubicifolius]